MKFAYLIEPPFNYITDTGVVSGCDVELARAVLSTIGIENVEFLEAEFSQLLPGLKDKRWDMTTGLFDTAERRENAAFSRPIWALADGLLVRKGNPKKLAGYADATMNDKCIVVAIRDQIQSTTALAAGVPEERITICETYEEAVSAVLEGRADAYASVAMAHHGYLAQNPSLDLDLITVALNEKPAAFGAFGFQKDNNALRNAVNVALEQYLGSNHHRAMMYTYGFTDADISLITSSSEKR